VQFFCDFQVIESIQRAGQTPELRGFSRSAILLRFSSDRMIQRAAQTPELRGFSRSAILLRFSSD